MLPQVQNDLPSPNFQHGFKKVHSTTTALTAAMDTITNGINSAPLKRSVVVALDLSKAFDTVDHRLLISDIAKTTLHPKLQRWISNYLMGRQAKVEFRGCTSKTRVIRQGVPQGGVISPQLFTFYIANMPTPPNNIQIITYADDITIISSDTNIAKASKSI
jgi:retron-type reverse transcriptase